MLEILNDGLTLEEKKELILWLRTGDPVELQKYYIPDDLWNRLYESCYDAPEAVRENHARAAEMLGIELTGLYTEAERLDDIKLVRSFEAALLEEFFGF